MTQSLNHRNHNAEEIKLEDSKVIKKDNKF